MAGINFRLDGLAHVLRDRLLAVPAYQRSYAWGPEQVEEYWADLRGALARGSTDYFMGTIVLAGEEDGRVTVIDGQQRLATTALLMAAVRDVFRGAGDQRRSSVIESDYVAGHDLRSGVNQPRLLLNKDDAPYFLGRVVEGDETVEATLPSQRRIRDAYQYLRSQLKEDSETFGSAWVDRLFEWADFLEKRVTVIVIGVPDEADAFLIFETLNDRGLALTISDLLKNYFLGVARESLEEVERDWLAMVANFAAGSSDEVATSYIRHYWSSINGPTRERELYRSIRDRVRGEAQAIELVRDLRVNSPLYAALLDAGHEKWRELGVSQATADSVLRFGLEQPRPLLLACMKKFEQPALNHVLTSLVSWLTRALVAGSIGGGTTERAYAQAARAVRRGKAVNASDVLRELSVIVPGDEEFANSFEVKRVPQSRMAKYMLLCVESSMGPGDAATSLVSSADEAEVSLVHLLPRGAGERWSGFDNTAGWFSRLGNQVLVPADHPVVVGGEWRDRRNMLEGVTRPLARSLVGVESWGPIGVDTAQREMARRAPAIWPLLSEWRA